MLTFRPQNEESLFDHTDQKPWLRARIVNLCDGMKPLKIDVLH